MSDDVFIVKYGSEMFIEAYYLSQSELYRPYPTQREYMYAHRGRYARIVTNAEDSVELNWNTPQKFLSVQNARINQTISFKKKQQ